MLCLGLSGRLPRDYSPTRALRHRICYEVMTGIARAVEGNLVIPFLDLAGVSRDPRKGQFRPDDIHPEAKRAPNGCISPDEFAHVENRPLAR